HAGRLAARPDGPGEWSVTSPAPPLLDVRDLGVRFDTPRGRLRAVDGVSFSLPPGTALGIVGESGSGKSVLSRAIMGILPRSAHVAVESEICFEGRDLRHLSRSESKHVWGVDISMVLQDPLTSLTPVLRIGSQVVEPMRYHLGLSRNEARERAVALLA